MHRAQGYCRVFISVQAFSLCSDDEQRHMTQSLTTEQGLYFGKRCPFQGREASVMMELET